MDEKLNVAATGSHVEVELVSKTGKRERLALDLVPDGEADFAAGLLSENTPLARAIMGQLPGTAIPYRVGDLVEVRLLSVTAGRRSSSEDRAAEREAKLRQALSRADLNNAINFALTFDSKWGDYDPEGIASNWDEGQRSEDKKNKRDDPRPEKTNDPEA